MKPSILLGHLVMAACLVGCGDDEPSKPKIAVEVSPATASVQVEQTAQFTAAVTGTDDQGVTWRVDGGSVNGTITTGGLYAAPGSVPAPPTVTVRATSGADASKSGTASVTVAAAPVVVTVEPGSATVEIGRTQQFSATVTGTANTAVTWSVEGGATNGAIDGSGLYTAPGVAPDPPTVTVVATSGADPSASGAAVVTVTVLVPQGFALVPAGSFTMGDASLPADYCGHVEYPVTLTEDFYLGQTEVTNRQYADMLQWAYDRGYVTVNATSVLDAMGSTQELVYLSGEGCEMAFADGVFSLRDAGYGMNPDHPVKQVRWEGAASYCDWMSLKEGFPQAYDHANWVCNGGDPYRATGFRLPTEAEWEYAAQYDDERTYPWGNVESDCTQANTPGSCVGWTTPAGSYPAEKVIGGRGLFDMGGNIMEWCNDWFKCPALPKPVDPPGWGSGSKWRVLRGGSWSANAVWVRCASPFWTRQDVPTWNRPIYGFRIARTVSP